MVVFTVILPQPLFGVVFWLWMALSMARFAVVVHRRMRLPLSLYASVNGALLFATFALLHALGQPLNTLPNPWFWILSSAGFVIGGLMMVERLLYPPQYKEWEAFMADKSFVDILLLNHIPDLRRR